MRCAVLRRALIFGFLTLIAAAPAIAESPKPDALVYGPWTKTCIPRQDTKGDCFTGRGARLECGLPVFSASIVERERRITLLVSVPKSVVEELAVRITGEQSPRVGRPYPFGDKRSRIVEYEADANLIDQMKQGGTLTIEAIDSAIGPLSLELPLAGFADAYDGPPQAPRVYERVMKLHEWQDFQARVEDESRKRAKQLARAENSSWPRCD
jgi:invasion protein IalB